MDVAADEVDIAIVGAGLSGISAALEIVNQFPSVSIRLLEANHRVGGRTLADADGTDFGAAYIGPTQDRIMRLVDENKQTLYRMNMSGKSTQYFSGKVKHYDGVIPPLSAVSVVDLGHLMAKFDALQHTINSRNPMNSPDAEMWDRMTVEAFLQREAVTEEARDAIRIGVRTVLAVEAAEISMLGFAWYVKQSGGVRRIFETEGGAQDSKVVGGAGNIAVVSASHLPPGTIRLGAAVRRIDYTDMDRIDLVCADGCNVRCRRVILALPPLQQLRIEFLPALHPNRLQSLQQYPLGHAIKTFMYYDRAFWRDKGLNGTAVCDKGISCVCFEDVKADGTKPCLMGFVLSSEAPRFSLMTVDERRAALAAQYRLVFDAPEALHPVNYKDKIWAEEPWVGGCYVGIMGPGVLTKLRMVHREPFADGRIFVAGTESAYCMVGYMDGAVEAGERIARNTLVSMGLLPTELYDVMSQPPPSDQLPTNSMELSYWEKHVPSVSSLVLCGVGLGLVAGVALLRLSASRSPAK